MMMHLLKIGQGVLWLCPGFSKLDAIVEKIFIDNAEGIILIPVWKHQT